MCMAHGYFIAFFQVLVAGDYGILLSRSITWLAGPKIWGFIDNCQPEYWSLWSLITTMKHQQNLLKKTTSKLTFSCSIIHQLQC